MAAPSRWERFKAWLDTKLTRLRYRLQGCRCYYENNAINMKFSSWGCPKHKQAEGANYWYMSHEGGYAGSGKEPSYFWPESKHQDKPERG